MDASSLSQIISGKRTVSVKFISNVCDRLSVNPALREEFLSAVKARKATAANSPAIRDEDFLLIAEDTFAYISNWYYPAILELTFTESFENDPRWIARTLSLTVSEVKIAIERLLRLGLLKEEDRRLVKTNKHLTNFAGTTTSATKELQRQVLQKALEAIDACEPSEKDITSMTMAIDEEKIPEAREKIKKFRRELCAFLESGSQKRVFNLGIQLYPLSKQSHQ